MFEFEAVLGLRTPLKWPLFARFCALNRPLIGVLERASDLAGPSRACPRPGRATCGSTRVTRSCLPTAGEPVSIVPAADSVEGERRTADREPAPAQRT
jgi:hypothetical protein